MSTTFIDVEGRRTRIRVAGDPAHLPVVLLHGIGRSLEDWSYQFPRLSSRYRLIALDLPGSGFSARSRSATTLGVLADAVLATLDALDELRPVHVIGNSLGGAVAQQMLATAPERVRSLVLADSAGFGSEVALPLRLLTIPVVGKLLASRTTTAAARLTERTIFADPALATSARVEHAMAIAQQPWTGEVVWETANALASLREGIRTQWRAELTAAVAAAGRPTLIVWGDRDRILPHRHLQAGVRAIPHASSHTFHGVGHMPQIEAPDEFATVVVDFIDGRTVTTRRSRSRDTATRSRARDRVAPRGGATP